MSQEIHTLGQLTTLLGKKKIPLGNHQFLKALQYSDAFSGAELHSDHIKIHRKSGKRSIHIYSGYSNGFESLEEIVDIFGDVERWESRRGWGVTHPINNIRPGNSEGAARSEKRDQQTCPTCFELMSLSNVCARCTV